MPAMSNPVTGQRLLPQTGNTGNNTDWIVNLPDGTYFWSVQAIDHTFAASQFSWEQTFTILNVDIPENIQKLPIVITNTVKNQILVKLPFKGKVKMVICDISGRVLTETEFENQISVGSSGWSKGIYFVKINIPGLPVFSAKIVK
jgi:hypothetical protein